MDGTIISGDDVTLNFTVVDQDDTAVNLTSATIIWEMFERGSATHAVIKTTGSGVTITGATDGEFSVTINGSDTEGLEGVFVHEAEITFPDTKVSTVTKLNKKYGTINILKDLVN